MMNNQSSPDAGSTQICPSVWWVGVNDRRDHLFEGLWSLPNGVSYNSYLVVADKIALIDTVEVDFGDEFFARIERVIGSRAVDYLVINHMEPDHSSSLAAVRRRWPDVTVVGNAKTLEMVCGYYGECPRSLAVTADSRLDLGGEELRFFLTPMVHWPETMMTYCTRAEVLFSGDAFGCFGALCGAVKDENIGCTEMYMREMVRYYASIVGKYGSTVARAIATVKSSGAPLAHICPAHGPVWGVHVAEVVAEYERMSRYECRKGVVIAYGSMYGNTARAAEYLATALADRGVAEIRVHNLVGEEPSFALADAFRFDTVLLGSPTYNGDIFPPVAALMQGLLARGVKPRAFGAFGSYTWAGQAVKKLAAAATTAGWNVLDASHDFRQGFAQCDTSRLDALADQIAAALR